MLRGQQCHLQRRDDHQLGISAIYVATGAASNVSSVALEHAGLIVPKYTGRRGVKGFSREICFFCNLAIPDPDQPETELGQKWGLLRDLPIISQQSGLPNILLPDLSFSSTTIQSTSVGRRPKLALWGSDVPSHTDYYAVVPSCPPGFPIIIIVDIIGSALIFFFPFAFHTSYIAFLHLSGFP